ncbi:unnamed protein product [Cladocopium goreaui]|uniref:DUF4116 domain-containing protein n=1 Tax=Cladocopium goreaui TaxID=2562237 RepID=A0A9P1D0S5_9DINO|nr:unnamed protein product [Cladocopium goreaui]
MFPEARLGTGNPRGIHGECSERGMGDSKRQTVRTLSAEGRAFVHHCGWQLLGGCRMLLGQGPLSSLQRHGPANEPLDGMNHGLLLVISQLWTVGDVVEAELGKRRVLGEICQLIQDEQKELKMVLRHLLGRSEMELRNLSREAIQERELVDSKEILELPLATLLEKVTVLTEEEFLEFMEDETIDLASLGTRPFFCRHQLESSDSLWSAEWNDENRKKRRQEALRLFRPDENVVSKVPLAPTNPKELLMRAATALKAGAANGDLPGRETEQERVMDFLRTSVKDGGRKEVLYVSGVPGTGKTASVLEAVRRLQAARKPQVQSVYVNAMCESPEDKKIFGHGFTGGLSKVANRDIVLAAVANDGFAVRHASDALRADREVALTAVRTNGSAVQYVAGCLAEDREVALTAVRSSGAALRYVVPKFRSDREVVLEAVRSYGQALKFVDEQLRCDEDVALAAVTSDFTAFQHVPLALKANRLIALAAVKQSARIFKSLPEDVKADREVALAAVSNDGFLLTLITPKLQHDRNIVLAAVSNSAVLAYASEEMQGDREIVLAAVRHEGTMLQFSSGKLKSDAEVVLTAVKCNGFAIIYADGKLRACREVMLEAVRNSGSVLQWAPAQLKEDLQVALAAVASNPAATKPLG